MTAVHFFWVSYYSLNDIEFQTVNVVAKKL